MERNEFQFAPQTELAALIDQFEAAWRKGAAPDLRSFLPVTDSGLLNSPNRLTLLCELIRIDLEYRWRSFRPLEEEHPIDVSRPDMHAIESTGSGCDPCRFVLDDYAVRFAELGPITDLPLDLIAEEYRVRHRFGDRPSHAEYVTRFATMGYRLLEALQVADREIFREHPTEFGSRADPGAGVRTVARGTSFDNRAPLSDDDYLLQKHLGTGGMGKVYQAWQHSLARPVAVKMLKKRSHQDPFAVERFLDEARIVAGLRHTGIVGVHGIGRTRGGIYFIVMELVLGRNLSEVAATDSISIATAVQWVTDVAETIDYAHKMGVVHCDLKPANLLLDDEARIRITDFGLARTLSGRSAGDHGIGGTVGYMAPEQLDPSLAEISPATDVYGLGALLNALLTGRPPGAGATKIHSADPPALEVILKKCLAPAPEARYPCALELADDLRKLMINESNDMGP